MWPEAVVFRPTIIWKATNQRFRQGYNSLIGMYNWVDFVEEDERGFRGVLLDTISEHTPFIQFLVDDDIFVFPFSTEDKNFQEFAKDPDTMCLSLRLSPQINHSYMRDVPAPPPEFVSENCWVWRGCGSKEWDYGMSLDGSVYRTAPILYRLRVMNYNGPNQLEGALADSPMRDLYMRCCNRSIVVGIPNNKTQECNPNNRSGNWPLDRLNDRWLDEERISHGILLEDLSFKHNAVHVEVPYLFESRE